MDFCPALDMANICIQLQATLNEQDKIDYPAWVQAIGTIVALGVAIAIPYFEHRRRSREASKKENLRLNVLASLFTHIEGLLTEVQGTIIKMATTDEVMTDDLEKFENVAKGLLERLKQVHISEASNPTQVFFILELEHGLGQVGNYFNEITRCQKWEESAVVDAASNAIAKRVGAKIAAAKALKEMFLGAMVKV